MCARHDGVQMEGAVCKEKEQIDGAEREMHFSNVTLLYREQCENKGKCLETNRKTMIWPFITLWHVSRNEKSESVDHWQAAIKHTREY